MKILAVIASPRKKGNTFEVVEKIANEMQSFGDIEVEYLFLSEVNLKLCKGCCACLTKGENYCPNNEDDVKIIEEKILSSDAVIFASPVYAMNMTALMKNFMDRFAFTMHRPRFFNQYTMIVAVTGSVGLKETINSISQLKYCGFNIVQTFGMVASSPLVNPSVGDEKMIKKIEKEAQKFYKIIKSKKPMSPSFDTIMQFKMQKKYFLKSKDTAPSDWEYFNSKGWFESKVNYYTHDANLGVVKNTAAKILAKFI